MAQVALSVAPDGDWHLVVLDASRVTVDAKVKLRPGDRILQVAEAFQMLVFSHLPPVFTSFSSTFHAKTLNFKRI